MSIRLLIIVVVFVVLAIIIALSFPLETTLDLARSWQGFATMYVLFTTIVVGILYTLAFAFTIPITTVLAIGLGFFYGFWPALLLVVSATLIGALSLFLAARTKLLPSCEPLLGSSYERCLTWARDYPIAFLLATRLAPLVPFPLAHLIPGEAHVRVRDFLLITLLGTVPASALFVALGASSHQLVMGEELSTLPLLAGVAAYALLIALSFILVRKGKIKDVAQEIQRTHPNQKVVPHGTMDA